MLDGLQHKSRQVEARHFEEMKLIRDRLTQEESNVVAMRQEGVAKDQHLKKLRNSVKEVMC